MSEGCIFVVDKESVHHGSLKTEVAKAKSEAVLEGDVIAIIALDSIFIEVMEAVIVRDGLSVACESDKACFDHIGLAAESLAIGSAGNGIGVEATG